MTTSLSLLGAIMTDEGQQLKIELLNDNLEMNAKTKQIIDAVSRLSALGTEGIQSVSETEPGAILAAFTALTELIEVQQQSINEHLEARLSMLDALETINDTHEAIKKRIEKM